MSENEQTPPPGVPPAEEVLTIPKGAFAERLARHHRTQLREAFGTEDPAEVKAKLERLAAMEAEAEASKRAQLSEIERMRLEAQEATTRAAALQEELDARAFEARVSAAAAKAGVRNVDYAMFEVIRHTERLPDGQSLDLEQFLTERLADPMSRAAFGVAEAVTPVPTGATTTPLGTPPLPPPPGGATGAPPDAFGMDGRAWAARKSALGLR